MSGRRDGAPKKEAAEAEDEEEDDEEDDEEDEGNPMGI
jgi:hypothetical protein